MGRLEEKVILVMGGTTGLGLSAAAACEREGAHVVVIGRNPDSVDAAAKQLGDRCLALAGDASVGTPMTVIEGGMTTFADSNPLRPALQIDWGLPVQDLPSATYFDWNPGVGQDITAFLTRWASLPH